MVEVAAVERLKVEEPSYEIIVDDISGDIASVRLYSDRWIDYLHVVKARGRWKLLHVAFTELPEESYAPSQAEGEEINAVVLDYIEAWYKGDAERHASAYQPECIKRAYADNGRDLVSTSPERMVEYCASGDTVLQNARWDIVIDDVAVDVATVRVYSTRWIDFLHLSNAHGRWGLFHVSYRGNTPMADH